MIDAHKLARQVVCRYRTEMDACVPHATNVSTLLRVPTMAVTLFCLLLDNHGSKDEEDAIPNPKDVEEKKSPGAMTTDWHEYLLFANIQDHDVPLIDWSKVDLKAYESISRRSKVRMEAFLMGVSLAVPGNEEVSGSDGDTSTATATVFNGAAKVNGQPPGNSPLAAAKKRLSDISSNQGLNGFVGSTTSSKEMERIAPFAGGTKKINRTISNQSSSRQNKYPQMEENELVTRLELYIRSLNRVKAQGQECVVMVEPPRAIKARARSIVMAFVNTVDTVHQQNAVLTRLLVTLTKELLAEEHLSDDILKLIRRIVSDYEQSISFASLAFLSSPEKSANDQLLPKVLKYLRYLQTNWQNCVTECEVERLLSIAIDPELRRTFKTIEFRSIGHLLEVCHEYRDKLRRVELPPGVHTEKGLMNEDEAVRQAIRDLQREVISINGQVLAPVKNRKDLIHLLSQSLNSRTLTTLPLKQRRKSRRKKLTSDSEHDVSFSEYATTSGHESEGAEKVKVACMKNGMRAQMRRRSSFRPSTINFLTKRLLLAASRTGTGGDAYFVVRDLFGGEDVEVVPSQHIYTHGRTVRPGSIEIIVKLASITIKCHGSFDVYPKSLVGECEPLIQIHTTTTETIALKEIRASDSCSEASFKDSNDSDDDEEDDDSERCASILVVEELKTDRTGWRTLSIRPALYEMYESFNTPS